MPNVLRLLLLAALLALVAPRPADAAGAFNQFVALGDSTLDSGYFRYTSTGNATADAMVAAAVADGAQGVRAGPGIMTTTFLAGRFGLSAEPVSIGGTNFGNGSAYTAPLSATAGGTTAPGGLPGNVTATEQIAFSPGRHNGGAANTQALYVVNSGNNDLIFVQKQGADWIAANPTFLNGVAAQFTASVARLQAAGARTVMVPNTFYTSTLTGLGGLVPPATSTTTLLAPWPTATPNGRT